MIKEKEKIYIIKVSEKKLKKNNENKINFFNPCLIFALSFSLLHPLQRLQAGKRASGEEDRLLTPKPVPKEELEGRGLRGGA